MIVICLFLIRLHLLRNEAIYEEFICKLQFQLGEIYTYEWKKAENGMLYITPSQDAKPSLYNPVKEYQDMVLAVIYIGTLAMNKAPAKALEVSIMEFTCKYGLLGLMSFQKEYAESCDWLATVFKDWAFTFFSSFLYCQDYDQRKKSISSGHGCIWWHCPNLSHRTVGQAYYHIGISLAATWNPDDVFIYAYG